MADIIITGVDLTSGDFRPISSNDIITNNDQYAIRGLGIGSSRGPYGLSPQGEAGITGSQGVTGPMGFGGPTGNMGITGTAGVRGLTGIGPTGIQGATSPQGITGLIGQTGARGVTGPQDISTYSNLTGPTTLTATAQIIGLNSTSGSFTVTLPSATGLSVTKTYILQDEVGLASTNPVLIYSEFNGGGPDDLYGTINGNSGIYIDSPFMALEIYSNGNRYIARISKQGATGIIGATGLA